MWTPSSKKPKLYGKMQPYREPVFVLKPLKEPPTHPTQQTFTCSKLTIQTLEKGRKYV